MFEPIFEEERTPVIAIVAKGQFGVNVVNPLTLPSEVHCLKFEEMDDLSKNDMTFIVADELSEEEWRKIRRATLNPIVAVGCTIPENTEFESCSLNETSVALCRQTIKSIIAAITQEGLINVDFADIKHVLFEDGKQAKAAYVEGILAEDAAQSVLNQFTDASVSLKKVKSVLINIIAGEQLELKDVNAITEVFTDKLNDDATIILGTTFDMEKSDKALDLSMVVTY